MLKVLPFFLLICLMAATTQKKKKIVFFGDSITEAGAKENGFIIKIDSILTKNGIKNNYELIGAGVSSDKIYDLYLRLENDVLKHKPDIVIIFIGVNDVWHKRILGTGTDADKFEKFYTAVLKKLADNNIKAIVCTPAAIGEKTDFSNELEGELNKYANIIRKIAAKNNLPTGQAGLPLIDLRKIFTAYNLKNNAENKDRGILTTDGVHLNEKGNEVVATEMWKAIKALN